MNSEELAEQVIDLQLRISYQEDSIQVMSLQIAKQADDLATARKHIQLLNNKLNEILKTWEPRQAPLSERPPHY